MLLISVYEFIHISVAQIILCLHNNASVPVISLTPSPFTMHNMPCYKSGQPRRYRCAQILWWRSEEEEEDKCVYSNSFINYNFTKPHIKYVIILTLGQESQGKTLLSARDWVKGLCIFSPERMPLDELWDSNCIRAYQGIFIYIHIYCDCTFCIEKYHLTNLEVCFLEKQRETLTTCFS